MNDGMRFTGGCLCGAVRFRIEGTMRDVVACHCGQCRRCHGNFAAYSACDADRLVVEKDDGLAWYASSRKARRGFCRQCGSSLFWDPLHADYIAVAAGALDEAPGLKLVRHIHVGDIPGWYGIADGLEQMERGMEGTGA